MFSAVFRELFHKKNKRRWLVMGLLFFVFSLIFFGGNSDYLGNGKYYLPWSTVTLIWVIMYIYIGNQATMLGLDKCFGILPTTKEIHKYLRIRAILQVIITFLISIIATVIDSLFFSFLFGLKLDFSDVGAYAESVILFVICMLIFISAKQAESVKSATTIFMWFNILFIYVIQVLIEGRFMAISKWPSLKLFDGTRGLIIGAVVIVAETVYYLVSSGRKKANKQG